MAVIPIPANRAQVTAPSTNWPAGIATGAVFLPAQQLFAVLGHEGAGDLIEALLTATDAYDGDTDREGTTGDGLTNDDEPDGDGGDWSWPESHGKGLIARVEPLAQHEDSEEDDPGEPNGDDEPLSLTEQDDDRDNDCEPDAGSDRRVRNHIRETRCRPRFANRWRLNVDTGQVADVPYVNGYDLKREPVVPRELRRLKRGAKVASNVVAFRRGAK